MNLSEKSRTQRRKRLFIAGPLFRVERQDILAASRTLRHRFRSLSHGIASGANIKRLKAVKQTLTPSFLGGAKPLLDSMYGGYVPANARRKEPQRNLVFCKKITRNLFASCRTTLSQNSRETLHMLGRDDHRIGWPPGLPSCATMRGGSFAQKRACHNEAISFAFTTLKNSRLGGAFRPPQWFKKREEIFDV